MYSNNELSNLSYTNKDFESIYPELLEYAAKMSYRWDPTTSTESDPGIVLLKLSALMADKNLYNIDKNVLELFPSSVTQLPNARQVFEQCGYTMKHYQSAKGYVKLTLSKHPENFTPTKDTDGWSYRIPLFTPICTEDSSLVYTMISSSADNAISDDIIIPNNGIAGAVSVIQGAATQYTINNDPLITAMHLDNNNRLYFNTLDIAENGIFVTNAGNTQTNYADWKKVNNLEIQPRNTLCYKFGISLEGTSCYIEFPTDINNLIGSGLNITYIRTDGHAGNAPKNSLCKFMNDVKAVRYIENDKSSQEVHITSENVVITNDFAIVDGLDPESIDDAYRSFKRVKNTFDTLVSIKDYTDYMITSNSASNGYVCDRVTDIQCAHKILNKLDSTLNPEIVFKTKEIERTETFTWINSDNDQQTVTGQFTEDVPCLDAFDLCLYALEYVANVESDADYLRTFTLVDASRFINSLSEDDISCIAHNFKTLKDYDSNSILMIKNKYPLNMHIIPQYQLSASQMLDVVKNVKLKLFSQLNSKVMTFGKSISYDNVYSTVVSADSRIKAVSINFPQFETYVVYKNKEGELTEVRIDTNDFQSEYSDDKKELINNFRSEIFIKNVLNGTTPLFDYEDSKLYTLTQGATTLVSDVSKISTQTKLTAKQSNEKYVITIEDPNENIVLYAPTYKQENSFGSYVKMIYSLDNNDTDNSTLTKDNIYEFKSTDFIIFFWKAHAEDKYYSYQKYSAEAASSAKHFSVSFSGMPRTQARGGKTDDTTWNTVIQLCAALATGSSILSSDFLNDVVTKMAGSSDFHVLSGQMYVNTLIPTTESLPKDKKCFWILNNKIKVNDNGSEVCRLFTTDQTEYMLKSGEYFIYRSDDGNILHVKGSGTLITRIDDNANERWECDVIGSFDSLSIDKLDELGWVSIPEAVAINEMEIHQLAKGSKLYYNLNSNDSNPDSNSNDSKVPVLDRNVTDVNSVVYEVDGAVTVLPDRPEGWHAYTILNINITPDTPQCIKSNHTVKYYKEDGSQETFHPDESDESNNTRSYYLLCDTELNLLGGDNVVLSPKTYTVNNNEIIPVYPRFNGVVHYSDISSESGTTSIDSWDDTLKVTVPSKNGDDPGEISVSICLYAGDYIFTSNSTENLDNMRISISGDEIPKVGASSDSFMLSVSEDGIYTLTFTNNDERNIAVALSSLTKYTTDTVKKIFPGSTEITDGGNTFIKDNYEIFVLDKLETYDPDGKFDYAYNPVQPVKNPLDPNSFFDARHVYNQFTICQWDVTHNDTNIDVVNIKY